MAILVLATLASSVGPATAQVAPPAQDIPRSVWVQPGTGNLDGIGTFLYVAPPAPGPTQASPFGYEYTLLFTLEGGANGLVAVGYKNGQRVTGFVMPGNATIITPYNWAYGHIYYLLTYRLSPTLWGAWIYDWTAGTWSLIGTQTVAESVGRMLPTSYTSVDWWTDSVPAPAADPSTCAYYPRIDAFWFAPMGWRGDVITNATLQGNPTISRQCSSTVTTENGWQHYTLGAPA